MPRLHFLAWFALLGLLAGCRAQPPASPDVLEATVVESPTLPPPAIWTLPSAASTAEPELTAAPPASRPLTPTATFIPSSVFPFSIPIAPPGRETVDPSYRFGSTQGGQREPHHGVEFLNAQGTPVLAAAGGSVLYAGDDNNGGPYSPPGWYAFYGLFVILEHQLSAYEEPVYTVYAHLAEVLVATGDEVEAGELLGLVGFTGAAIGSHLHFEVRYGGSAYEDSRNPELWLQPHPGSGALAGSIVDPDGLPLPVMPLQLSALDGSGYAQYFSTYEDGALAFLPPYNEDFALGNLPAGSYELSFVAYTLERHRLDIRPGEITFLEITLSKGE